jgi:hypothetical protein
VGLSDLPLKERAARYRELATEAKREAAFAQGAERRAFMDIAGGWSRLAQLAEQQLQIDGDT